MYHYCQLDPPPEFLASRQQLWDQLKKEYDDWVAVQERVVIKVTLPDGKVVEGKAWETSPYDVAKGIRSVNFTSDFDVQSLQCQQGPVNHAVACMFAHLFFSLFAKPVPTTLV